MRLYELFSELDKHSIERQADPVSVNNDGSKSPLTGQGDAGWQQSRDNIYNWFKRPFLTNGPKDNYRLPIKKSKV